jgi:hypothetical protein
MTLVDDHPLETHIEVIQVLFEEARKRRRRRWITGLLVLALLLTVVAVVAFPRVSSTNNPVHKNSGPSSVPSALKGPIGATIVYSFNRLLVLNADTGASRSLPEPALPGGASDASVLRIGDSMLLNKGDRAWLFSPGLTGRLVDLGPSLRIIPGPTLNQVWLWSDPDARYVRLVNFSDKQIGPDIALPAGWFPTGDVVDQGLLIAPVIAPPDGTSNPDDLEVWNPESKRVTFGLRDADLVAADGSTVAWSRQPCLPNCAMHLTNVQTGNDLVLRLPSGSISSGEGAFSPDKDTLAVPIELATASPPARSRTAMVLVDLEAHVAALLSGSVRIRSPTTGRCRRPGRETVGCSSVRWAQPKSWLGTLENEEQPSSQM